MRSMHVRTATGTYLLRRSRSNACDTLMAARERSDRSGLERNLFRIKWRVGSDAVVHSHRPPVPRQRNRAVRIVMVAGWAAGRIVRVAKRLRHAWHRAGRQGAVGILFRRNLSYDDRGTQPAARAGEYTAAFTLPSTQGKPVDTADLLGRALVLFFYLSDAVDGFAEIVTGFRDLYPEFEKLGIAVVGVGVQDVETQKKWVQTLNLPYPLASDADGHVAFELGIASPNPDDPNTRRPFRNRRF